MKTPCKCYWCRRGVRLIIEQTFEQERCWLGRFALLCLGHLEWLGLDYLQEVLDEMCNQGLLIRQLDHPKKQRRPISIYMLSRLTVPAECRKGGRT